MDVRVTPDTHEEVAGMREAFRREANCQIIADSAIRRGIADAYLVFVDEKIAGYGGIWNKYHEGRAMEFHTGPDFRRHALPMFSELLKVGRATHVAAQTNMPLMTVLLFDCANNIQAENFLFADGPTTALECPGSVFRPVKPEDKRDDDWVLEVQGEVVAWGGYLTHYNPPYADLYMETAEDRRRKGYASYFLQELKRVTREASYVPAARCNGDNVASRKTLEKAGLLVCGRLLVGEVA
jgi:GNAT superfamily N-acetyltransferase